MDNYYYKCSECGYVHLVPAYWMSFSPQVQTEAPHCDPQTGVFCANITLDYYEPDTRKESD